jgi:magnesium-transporting ATPase (P-type)
MKLMSCCCFEYRIGLHGHNWMDIEVKGWLTLLVDEVLNPFYLFQLGSIVLWCLDDYIYYATTVLVISAGSIAISLVETRRQAKMLRKMATSEEKGIVRVKNPGGGVDEVISRDLVPGDVILIPSQGCILPCDVILTRGAVLVNEAMLTGESTPVQVNFLKKFKK